MNCKNISDKNWKGFHLKPLFKNGKGEWFFYDETWAHSYGPYRSAFYCIHALFKYCKGLNRENKKSNDSGS